MILLFFSQRNITLACVACLCLCLQEEQYIPFNEQQKCHVTLKYLQGEEKQKYRITLFCKKNKSIILHYVLPNSPEKIFLRPCQLF